MNTPAHLLIGAAAMARPANRAVVWAAFAGALLPDLSLYLLAGGALIIWQIPPQIVFDELYFSDAWQTVFAIDNSFVLWGVLLGIAIWRGAPWAIALTGAALLHLALDFPLHHDDGRPHFWPLSDWIFESPLSYWDRDHGAMWLGPVEAIAASLAAISLWYRQLGWTLSIAAAILLMAELWVVRQWLFFFVDG
ncbi:cobalamin biosynthesis protein CobQ [uncultured Roseobacter sp.]|uniref:cobalamin biosynthesis protein CobQ n=1 Tax=uncultured Roseobacter sp. TaxID=114847 RepID=UPI002609456D|nr:cobalamin biosynthesis protein CobQ [uncultured Roseobacter sp.]